MFQLSDTERAELRESARRLLAERSSSQHVRALLDDPTGFDRSLWASMAELGWLAIAVPEEHGGMGASLTDLAVILHELGRRLTPAPAVSNAVLAASALTDVEAGAELLPLVAGGEQFVAFALASSTGSYEPSLVSVEAVRAGDGSVVRGTSRFTPDAHIADQIVVAVRDPDGEIILTLVERSSPRVSVEIEPTYDQTRRLAKVTLEDVPLRELQVLACGSEGTSAYRRLVSLGKIAVLCDAVGAAESILEISNEYAKQRVQFKRPIGSFQAVKHHLANMFTDVEASRAAVLFACDAIDGGGDARHAASVAASFAGPACARVAGLAVQVHGGIGFTWEHDAHLFLKRIRLDEALFGTPKWHREQLARILIDDRLSI